MSSISSHHIALPPPFPTLKKQILDHKAIELCVLDIIITLAVITKLCPTIKSQNMLKMIKSENDLKWSAIKILNDNMKK